jgi:hypothetical protein
MNRLEFLKRFGLLAAIATVVPGCASPRGGNDDDGEKKEMGERHENSHKEDHDENGEKHEKDDDDDAKSEKEPEKSS